MPAVSAVFRFIQQALRAFFQDDIQLRRRGKRVRLVTQKAVVASRERKQAVAEAASRQEHDDLVLLQRELAGLLSEAPDTRRRCRHLAFVEHAIERKGLRALHKLPLEVLRPALEQLESLVINWSPQGLANLRSKMAVAIIDREHMDPAAEADAYNTAMPLEALQGPTLPPTPGDVSAEDRALAAAYAALAMPSASPELAAARRPAGAASRAAATGPATAVPAPAPEVTLPAHMQGDLASPSARALARAAARAPGALPEIKLRTLQDEAG